MFEGSFQLHLASNKREPVFFKYRSEQFPVSRISQTRKSKLFEFEVFLLFRLYPPGSQIGRGIGNLTFARSSKLDEL